MTARPEAETRSDTAVYAVFGRTRATEPLAQLGTVRAPNVDLACSYARTTYDEDHWLEMVVVPQGAITTVIAPSRTAVQS